MYGVASFILFILWFFNPEQHYILWASAVFGVIDCLESFVRNPRKILEIK